MPTINSLFTHFEKSIADIPLPGKFTDPFDNKPHPLCVLAAEQLQQHLSIQTDWEHNFGLVPGMEGAIIGKMFGVLVVENEQNELGYLAAFSGTLAGVNNQPGFVPAIYDALIEEGFLNDGMLELKELTRKVRAMEDLTQDEASDELIALKKKRKAHSSSLTAKLFEEYFFLNRAGEEKSLQEIFEVDLDGRIPGGAGDCAAPKLLQYAFQHNMKPLAMAEFFWGTPRTSDYWKHKHYYPACDHKCRPILKHMLKGM